MLRNGPARRIAPIPIPGRVRAAQRDFARLMVHSHLVQIRQLQALDSEHSLTPTVDCGGTLDGPTRPSPRSS